VEEDAQVNDLGPNAVFPYTLHLCLKSKSMLCFVLGLCTLVRLRMRFSSPTGDVRVAVYLTFTTPRARDGRVWRRPPTSRAEHHQFAIGLPN
jgi:hypothetical protein